MQNNKRERILVSFAGNTDPLGGEHANRKNENNEKKLSDGPVVRICRFYRPKKIYLILTKEMQELQKNNIYEEAIRANIDSYDFELIPEPIDVENAHYFNIYCNKIIELFERIKSLHPESEILVNVTSGTPQMIANLVNYIVNSTGINITPVQVGTPNNSSNNSDKSMYNNYNAVTRSALNDDKKVFDNIINTINSNESSQEYDVLLKGDSFDTEKFIQLYEKEGGETRLILPDLSYYTKVLLKGHIEKLLNEYEYDSCIKILEQKVFKNQKQIETLVKFAESRKNIAGVKSNEILKEIETDENGFGKYYYYKKDATKNEIPLWYMLADYFQLAIIKAKSRDCAGYTLMIEPITTNLYLSILQDILGQPLNTLFEEEELPLKDNNSMSHNVMYKLTNEKYDNIDEGKFRKFENKKKEDSKKNIGKKVKYGYYPLRSGDKNYVNTHILGTIINYYLERRSNPPMTNNEFQKLEEILGKIKNTRNAFAHSLNSIPMDDFEKIAEIPYEKINQSIEDFLKKYYSKLGYKEMGRNQNDMITLYDDLNKEILNIIEEDITQSGKESENKGCE